MTRDFTLETYKGLCRTISSVQMDCRFIRSLEDTTSSSIILRHDVDRKPKNALRMAKLENNIGIKSTYYFRCVPSSFDPKIIHQISEMGHEIGYHYEVMSRAKGDIVKAKELFREDIEELNSICEIRTACMHGSPESRYDNIQFWNHTEMASYGIIGEAYHDVAPDFQYYTDTGGKWNSRFNIRDKIKGCNMPYVVNTQTVVNSLKSGGSCRIYINCHPERWSEDRYEALKYRFTDLGTNLAKSVICRFRGAK